MEATWLADIWQAAKAAGPFGLLIITYLWWSEREERRALQRERDGLLERVLKGLNDVTTSIGAAVESTSASRAAIYAVRDLLLTTAERRRSDD